MHQDSEERSRNPTGGWTKTTCTCWRVSCGGVGQQGLTTGMGGLDTVLQSPLWCKPSWRSPLTRPWMPIRLSDFSTETLQATREWHDIFKVMKGKNLQPRILYPAIVLQIWWKNQKLSRQAKVKRIQHHQTSFTANAKGISLGRKHKRRKRLTENKPKIIKNLVIGSYKEELVTLWLPWWLRG